MSNVTGEPIPGATPSPDAAKPPVKEQEPSPNRALRIKNEYPGAIYDAIEAQIVKKDYFLRLSGEPIGFLRSENPNHPLKDVKSRVRGNLVHTQWEDIPEKPGSRRGVGEQIKEFDIDTSFRLPNHTFIDEARTTQLVETLKQFGYESNLVPIENGNRKLVITTPEGSFDLVIGWPNADAQVQYHRQQIEEYKVKYPDLVGGEERQIEKVLKGEDESSVHLEMSNSHPSLGPSGIPLESREQVVSFLSRTKDLSEVVATALVQAVSPGKRFPELKMDWLPPQAVKQMETRTSSEVVGKVEATVAVETEVKEDFGLEKLAGLAPETLTDLRRIRDRLKEPDRAAFMKKYGFKQSNGAVFWGIPGTGKTLAGEALAEETGCERVVLKIDEYMTAYIHDSAHRIGERLREIKTQSSEKGKPVIIQIDEADTILRPVDNSPVSGRDASEIRAVLLREFQEPSNVFYILTTNLDPRDPRQADPAIVRNQRLGYLLGFGLPTQEGRSEIFDKEIKKRAGEDLKWEGVDLESLAVSSDGFSPADIQEVLSVAVGEGYNPETGAAFVNQQHLEIAINLIKSRKLLEEKIRRPLGFLTNQNQK